MCQLVTARCARDGPSSRRLARFTHFLGFRDSVLVHWQRVRFEFKSKAVVHFDQDKALIASASLSDNGAVHTLAINALTIFDLVHAHPALSSIATALTACARGDRLRIRGSRDPQGLGAEGCETKP